MYAVICKHLPRQNFSGLPVENVEAMAQEIVGLFPYVRPFERQAFVDQEIGDA